MAIASPATTDNSAYVTAPVGAAPDYSDLAFNLAMADQIWDGSSIPANDEAPEGAVHLAAADLGYAADLSAGVTFDDAHGANLGVQIAAIDFDSLWTQSEAPNTKPAWLDAFDAKDPDMWDPFKLLLADANDPAPPPKDPDPDNDSTTQTKPHHAGSGNFWTPYTPPDPPSNPPEMPKIGLADSDSHTPTTGAEPVWSSHAPDDIDPNAWAHGNTPPVVWINHPYGPVPAFSLVGSWVSFADADGDFATQYQFRDDNADPNSATIWLGVTEQAPGASVTVDAGLINGVGVFAGGAGTSDNIWVRASDGKDWSDWQPIHFATDSSGNTSGVFDTLVQPNLGDFSWSAGPGPDTFPFESGDVFHIINFDPAADAIAINNTSLADFNAILANTHDDSQGNAVITRDGGGTVTLDHVSTSQLHASNFLLT